MLWPSRYQWAKRSQNVKNNLIDHLGPLESKRSFLATFSDEIGRCEVSKPNYLLLLRLKVKLKMKMVSSFWGHPSIDVHVPSIEHFHHFHFLKTICNHNLEQEQVKP